MERQLSWCKLQKSLQEKNAKLDNEIAKRKQLSTQLRYYQDHVEELVEQRTQRLRVTNEALTQELHRRKQAEELKIRKERLATASRLSAAIAHEINNPLQSVIALLGLVYKKLAPRTDLLAYLSVIDSEIQRVALIINGMQELYRPCEGEKVQIEINALLEKLLLLVQKPCEENGIKIVWQPTVGLSEIKLVPTQIRDLFLNILLNAIEAMPNGGQLQVRTSTTLKPARIRVQFSDLGIGMSYAQMEQIFDPFYTTKLGHLGLGLAICFNIVEQHDGYIEVESTLSKGSTFTVSLPANNAES